MQLMSSYQPFYNAQRGEYQQTTASGRTQWAWWISLFFVKETHYKPFRLVSIPSVTCYWVQHCSRIKYIDLRCTSNIWAGVLLGFGGRASRKLKAEEADESTSARLNSIWILRSRAVIKLHSAASVFHVFLTFLCVHHQTALEFDTHSKSKVLQTKTIPWTMYSILYIKEMYSTQDSILLRKKDLQIGWCFNKYISTWSKIMNEQQFLKSYSLSEEISEHPRQQRSWATVRMWCFS